MVCFSFEQELILRCNQRISIIPGFCFKYEFNRAFCFRNDACTHHLANVRSNCFAISHICLWSKHLSSKCWKQHPCQWIICQLCLSVGHLGALNCCQVGGGVDRYFKSWKRNETRKGAASCLRLYIPRLASEPNSIQSFDHLYWLLYSVTREEVSKFWFSAMAEETSGTWLNKAFSHAAWSDTEGYKSLNFQPNAAHEHTTVIFITSRADRALWLGDCIACFTNPIVIVTYVRPAWSTSVPFNHTGIKKQTVGKLQSFVHYLLDCSNNVTQKLTSGELTQNLLRHRSRQIDLKIKFKLSPRLDWKLKRFYTCTVNSTTSTAHSLVDTRNAQEGFRVSREEASFVPVLLTAITLTIERIVWLSRIHEFANLIWWGVIFSIGLWRILGAMRTLLLRRFANSSPLWSRSLTAAGEWSGCRPFSSSQFAPGLILTLLWTFIDSRICYWGQLGLRNYANWSLHLVLCYPTVQVATQELLLRPVRVLELRALRSILIFICFFVLQLRK